MLLFERDGLDCSKFDDVVAADRVCVIVLVVYVFFSVLVCAFSEVLTSDKQLLFYGHEGKAGQQSGSVRADLDGTVTVDTEEVSRLVVADDRDAFGAAGFLRQGAVRNGEQL